MNCTHSMSLRIPTAGLVLTLCFAVLAASGCANPKRAAVEEALATMSRTSMQRVESKDQVAASLAARERLDAARREYGRWLRCEDGPESGTPRSACDEREKEREKERAYMRARDDDPTGLDRVEVTGSSIARTQLEGAMPVTSAAGQGAIGELLSELPARGADRITNNQSAYADEGDIVKKVGALIIVLREGRLFVLRIRNGDAATLELVDKVDVVPGVRDPDLGIDEVLAFPGGLIVLGYNYDQRATELFVFRLALDGRIERGPHHQIRSEDYHTGDNYGARIVGDQLVMVASAGIDSEAELPLPQWRRVDSGPAEWGPMVVASNFFLPLGVYEDLHSNMVLRCPLAGLLGSSVRCEATAILGGPMTPYHVTERAVYLAIQGWNESVLMDPEFSIDRFRNHREESMPHESELMTAIYEVPFARFDRPRVARLVGDMTDRFAFEERDGRLLVVTHMRIPGDQFKARLFEIDWAGSGSEFAVPARQLGEFDHPLHYFGYRFDSNALWLGSAQRIWWKDPGDKSSKGARDTVRKYDQPDDLRLFALPLAGGRVDSVPITHSADRIERFGDHLFITGPGRTTRWTASIARYDGRVILSPAVDVPRHFNAEHMSHAFNAILADGRLFAALPGAPLTAEELRDDEDPSDIEIDDRVSDLVIFEGVGDALMLREPIDMQTYGAGAPGDECDVSCTDWYGNARAFGTEGRVFALSAAGFVEVVFEGEGNRILRSVRLTR